MPNGIKQGGFEITAIQRRMETFSLDIEKGTMMLIKSSMVQRLKYTVPLHYERYIYLGVFPANGFLVARNDTKPLMTEKMSQMKMNLHQSNLRQRNIGMIHIPNNVAICNRQLVNTWHLCL